MNIFSWVRSYYIYFYYYHAIKNEGEKPFKPRGFIATTLLVTSFNVLSGIIIYSSFIPFKINEFLRVELINIRGPVTPMLLIIIVLASLVTYFMCCYKVKFEEIEHRLSKTPWLSERSNLKLVSLFFLSVVLMLIMGPLFH